MINLVFGTFTKVEIVILQLPIFPTLSLAKASYLT